MGVFCMLESSVNPLDHERKQHVTIDPRIYDTKPSWSMTNDLIFKAVFGRNTPRSKLLLMDLVNTVLHLEGDERIVGIEHKNPYNYQKYIDDKLSILDIKAETESGMLINVEMQVNQEENYIERSLFYWSKMFSEQLEVGQDYGSISKTVGIHFLKECLPYEGLGAHVQQLLIDKRTMKFTTNKLEIHLVQMPMINAIIKAGESDLAQWLTMMKDINNQHKQMEIEVLVNQKEVMKMAMEEYSKVTAEDMLREQMIAREKFIIDQNTRMNAARKKGLKEGLEQGQAMAIHKMYASGMSSKKIAEIIELSEAQVSEILRMKL